MMDYWVVLCSVLLSLLKDSVAEYCGIDTNHGRRYVFCYQKCCDEYDRTTYDVCCTYDYPSTGMVIGGGVGLLVVFVTFVLCCFYACCKRKLRYRQRLQGNNSNQGRNTVMPTICDTVTTPIQPPSYEELTEIAPPPYTTDNLGFITEQTSSTTQQNVYPDYPPPKYSKSDKLPS